MPPTYNRRNSETIPFVDVGSGVGWFTFITAAWGFHTLSIEPMDENTGLFNETLCANIKRKVYLAERVDLHAVALGSDKKECVLLSTDDDIGNGVTVCSDTLSSWDVKAQPYKAVNYLMSVT